MYARVYVCGVYDFNDKENILLLNLNMYNELHVWQWFYPVKYKPCAAL